MRNILFPTDFTNTTTPALNWVRLFARRYNATVYVLHVFQPMIPDTTLPTMGDMGAGIAASHDIEEISRENLAELVSRLAAEGINCQSEWRAGAVESEILDAARECQADLIITGRTELNTFFDRLAGSAATDVAIDAPCPVLVIPMSGDPDYIDTDRDVSRVGNPDSPEARNNDIRSEGVSSNIAQTEVGAPMDPQPGMTAAIDAQMNVSQPDFTTPSTMPSTHSANPVPASSPTTSGDPLQNNPVHLRTVVYATQLEFDESKIVGQALEIARTFGASLKLLKVNADNQPDVFEDKPFLDTMRQQFGYENVEVHSTHSNSVSGGLTDYLEKHKADLLIMTTRERHFLDGLLNPSLTQRMINRSTIPVLVYHTHDGYM